MRQMKEQRNCRNIRFLIHAFWSLLIYNNCVKGRAWWYSELRCLLGWLHPLWECLGLSPAQLLWCSFLLMYLRGRRWYTWVPATHRRNSAGIPGSWLQHDPAPVFQAFVEWTRGWKIEFLSLSPSLSLNIFSIFHFQAVPLLVKWVSCRNNIIGYFYLFLIHSVSECFLTRELSLPINNKLGCN